MTLPVSQSFAVTPGAGIAQAAAASQQAPPVAAFPVAAQALIAQAQAAATEIGRLAESEAGDERQEYDKPGYEKDFDNEWHEHKHLVYIEGKTTTKPPFSGAPLRVSLAGAAAVAAVGLALI